MQTDKGHRKHANQNRRSDTPRNKRAKREISPTGGGNQVTRQTRGTIDRPRGTSQDCTRVFPVKGAANALCNPETDVRGGTCKGHAGFRGDPSYDTPKSSGPTPAASLQDKRAKGGPALSNQGSRVLESTLPLRGRHRPPMGKQKRAERGEATTRWRSPMLQQSRKHPWEPRYRQGDDQQQKTREEPMKG